MVFDPGVDPVVDRIEVRSDREREILAEAARAVLSHRTLGSLTEVMCRLAAALVAAERACVLAWRGDAYSLTGSFGQRIDEFIEDCGFDRRQAQRLMNGGGFVAVPLAASANAQALTAEAFLLVGRKRDREFDAGELGLLQELAALLAAALRTIELETALARVNRTIEESNEFKSDVLAMLAHDFKGPLTVILGYCELLLGVARRHREEVEMIHAQTLRLVRLTEDALILAQTQAEGFSLARSVVDLGLFVAESVDASSAENTRVILEVPATPALVELDPARFRHVVDNLVGNALKYSEDEVRVTVRVEGANAIVEVSDRGIGVPANELPTLFTRFGRASNARRKGIAGSGIGLYVARKIVWVHRGTITARSIENEGSTFTVTLPLASAGSTTATTA
jgi:signal transduction histidine kinase